MPEVFEDARGALLPSLHCLAGLDQSRLLAGHEKLDPITDSMFPFALTILVSVVHDSERAMQQVNAETMRRWGMTPAKLHAVAVDNLRHKAPPAFQQISAGLWRSPYGECYDAARIFLPELAWQLGLAGQPVAMVPSRSGLLLAGEQDADALLAMVSQAREALATGSRPLASEMLRWDGQQWQPREPTQAAAAEALAQLQAEMQAG